MIAIRLTLLTFCLSVPGILEALEVSNTVKNSDGEAVAAILVHARPQGDNPAPAQTTRTSDEGSFSFSLPEGRWYIEVDPAELLERGYFCVPGWFPGGFEPPLTAIPLRPDLRYELKNGDVSVVASFDWQAGLEPVLLRVFRIERSVDMKNWESIGSIELADPPIRLDDPYGDVKRCFYRVVEEPVRVLEPIRPLEP